VPRPGYAGKYTAIGKVFVEFSSISEALSAGSALAGRGFGDMVVTTSYFDQSKYSTRELE
jgi:hypothetical protein